MVAALNVAHAAALLPAWVPTMPCIAIEPVQLTSIALSLLLVRARVGVWGGEPWHACRGGAAMRDTVLLAKVLRCSCLHVMTGARGMRSSVPCRCRNLHLLVWS